MRRSPIQRHTLLRARVTGLRARSKKQAAVYRERRKLVARTLERRPWCEVKIVGVCAGRSTACHETLTRARGGSILDPALIVATCDPCHGWIHAHPVLATARGWLESASMRRED